MNCFQEFSKFEDMINNELDKANILIRKRPVAISMNEITKYFFEKYLESTMIKTIKIENLLVYKNLKIYIDPTIPFFQLRLLYDTYFGQISDIGDMVNE